MKMLKYKILLWLSKFKKRKPGKDSDFIYKE